MLARDRDGPDIASQVLVYHNFPGLIHGFFNMASEPLHLENAGKAYDLIASDLAGEFSPAATE